MKNKYEFILFFRKNIWKIMVAVILQLFMASTVISETVQSQGKFDFFQLWIMSFDGNREYVRSEMEPFELPILWIVFQLYALFLVGDNLVEQLQGYGMQQFLRCKKRKNWMIGKTVTSTFVIVMYYLFYALLLEVWAKMNGGAQFSPGAAWSFSWKYLAAIIGLPMLVSLTFCYVQNAVCLLWNPYAAYIISIGMLIMSSYWKNNLLIGNYAMLMRNQMFREDGVSTENGVAVCLLYSVLAVGCGMLCIKRYDVLGKGRK